MRRPSERLIVDAAILVAAASGTTYDLLTSVLAFRELCTTRRAIDETVRRIALGWAMPELVERLQPILEQLQIVDQTLVDGAMPEALRSLRRAPAAGNGSTDDAHILAAAWALDSDIWTHDRDFAGCGMATWSSANLWAAIMAEAEIG